MRTFNHFEDLHSDKLHCFILGCVCGTNVLHLSAFREILSIDHFRLLLLVLTITEGMYGRKVLIKVCYMGFSDT